jgi:hypothetical protein
MMERPGSRLLQRVAGGVMNAQRLAVRQRKMKETTALLAGDA